MPATLRHAGILVEDLEASIAQWQAIGFEPLEVEALRVCKEYLPHKLKALQVTCDYLIFKIQ